MATAPEILKRAAQHMEDRAAARDQAGGERSMARTVAAFNALTGHQVSERDGWLFMAVLKAARACTTPTGIPDDYEDGAAYFGLAGEAAGRLLIDSGKRQPANDNRLRRATINGNTFDVPDGHNFVAQDSSGSVYAYRVRPCVIGYSWDCEKFADMTHIGSCPVAKDWRQTLIELPA